MLLDWTRIQSWRKDRCSWGIVNLHCDHPHPVSPIGGDPVAAHPGPLLRCTVGSSWSKDWLELNPADGSLGCINSFV